MNLNDNHTDVGKANCSSQTKTTKAEESQLGMLAVRKLESDCQVEQKYNPV
jgi:hypothetical protein